jgi:hypothetical protein
MRRTFFDPHAPYHRLRAEFVRKPVPGSAAPTTPAGPAGIAPRAGTRSGGPAGRHLALVQDTDRPMIG